MGKLTFVIVAFAALCNVLLAVEMSKGECNTFRELFGKFMNASDDQDNVGDIDSEPVKFIIDDPSIAEHPRRVELQEAIKDFIDLRNQLFRNASGALIDLTNDRITSNSYVLASVYENRQLFENNTILALTCAMAEEAQKQTDDYVYYVQNKFTELKEKILDESDNIINDVLEKVRNHPADAGTVDNDTRMGKAIQSIRLMTAQNQKLYKERDSFFDDVSEKADKVEAAYKGILEKLEAQRSATPELAPGEN